MITTKLFHSIGSFFGRRQSASLSSLTGQTLNAPIRSADQFLEMYKLSPWLRAVESRIGDSVSSVRWRVLAVRRSNNSSSIRGKLRKLPWSEVTKMNGSDGGRFIRDYAAQSATQPYRKQLLDQLKQAGELIEIEDHPLAVLIARPNPHFGGRHIRKLISLYMDLLGEVFLLKERGPAKIPIALWPIPPTWVRDLPDPASQDPSFRLQFPGGQSQQVPASEMLWLFDPDPASPYGRGTGFVRSLSDDLDVHEYIAKYKRGFFLNSARPDFIGTIEGLSESDIKRLGYAWNAEHQSFWRSFKAHFMNKKMDIHEFQTSWPAPITDLSREERDIIIQVIGIPPEKLGITETSNRATSEAASYTMDKEVVIPRLETQRELLQDRLVPEFDDRLVLDYESPLREDRESQLKAAEIAPWSLLVDELRSLAGFDAKEDGDGQVHMVPINLIPVASLSGFTPPDTGDGDTGDTGDEE